MDAWRKSFRVGEEEEEKETLAAAVLLLVQICLVCGGMAMRAMTANLKQKLPVAVQRVFASSRAPGTSSKPPTALDSLDPELRRQVLNEVAMLIKTNRRNDLVAAGAVVSCGGILISYALYRLSS